MIQFQNVKFGYGPDRLILSDVTFTIPLGQTVAVVGETGSGKTTIARLLLRFYDPVAGEISIGGVNIQDVSRYALRQRIGVVPQETVLFNDTLRYNIAYGNHDASMTQIDAAVEVAGLTGFVRALPDGLETEVGTRGLKLSCGEKQRVAIARAVLKEPAIMIFDEATSSLDTATEAAIQANLERVAAQQTTLIIAHRLSTVTHADRIVVLADGRVAEQGAHQELIDRGGLYAQLWQIQSQSVQPLGN